MRRFTSMIGAAIGVLVGVEAAATDSNDNRVQWLRQHVIEIATPRPLANDDADLRPLADVLADARVVQLGEQTHGDGTAFLLRTRLVRFLHEQLGFDAVAFESGFYECQAVQAALSTASISLHEAIDRGVYPIWAESRQMQHLFAYLRGTHASARPVEFFGFDVQFSHPSTRRQLPTDLMEVLERVVSPGLDAGQRQQLDSIVQAVAGAGQYKIDVETHVSNQQFLERLRSTLRNAQTASDATEPSRSLRWWVQVINGLKHMERTTYLRSLAPPFNPARPELTFGSPFAIRAGNARDLGMAENIQWWLDGPGQDRKLIVWAANNHVGYRRGTPTGMRLPDEREKPVSTPAGVHVQRMLGDEAYTFLTVVYSGDWAAPSIRTAEGELRWTEGDHPPAATGTLAALLHEAGRPLALLDLRAVRKDADHWLNQPIVIRADLFNGEAVIPSRCCDGILFIDHMEPSVPRTDRR